MTPQHLCIVTDHNLPQPLPEVLDSILLVPSHHSCQLPSLARVCRATLCQPPKVFTAIGTKSMSAWPPPLLRPSHQCRLESVDDRHVNCRVPTISPEGEQDIRGPLVCAADQPVGFLPWSEVGLLGSLVESVPEVRLLRDPITPDGTAEPSACQI